MTRLLLLFLLMVIPQSVTHAENGEAEEGLLNKLLAPGPMQVGHKDLEGSDCLKCHVPRGGVPDSKCLDCHKELRPDVEGKRGFHGLTQKTCIECHSEHKGRAYDSTLVDEKKFDHSATGYRLEGKHAELKCTKCHIEKRSKVKKVVRPGDPHFLGLKVTCVSCHKKDDVHFYVGPWAKKDCVACHELKSWKEGLKFDHAKDGHFKLEGKHDEIECAACHVPKKGGPSRYQWPALKKDQCLSCHVDQHAGQMSRKFSGGDCTKCHDQTRFKLEKFDHSVTGLTLRGKHAELQCVDCHKQKDKKLPLKARNFHFAGLKADCLSCHKDYHQFSPTLRSQTLGSLQKCETCHNDRSWKQIHKFDHGVHTRYPIAGKHVGLKCEKCHVPDPQIKSQRIYHWQQLATKTCEVCHKSPHLKTFSKEMLAKKCTDCHVDDGWKIIMRNGKRFDHTKATRFPLTGKHEKVQCQECHGTGNKQIFKFAHFEQDFCVDCHKNVHTRQFTSEFSQKKCSTCHDTSDFRRVTDFKHDETDFKLRGKHIKPECTKCHVATSVKFDSKYKSPMGKFLFNDKDKRYCNECHENVHTNQFHSQFSKQSCATCHTDENFTERKVFNHDETSYRLIGKHTDVKCQKCHIPSSTPFKGIRKWMSVFVFQDLGAKSCSTCHKDPHKGALGTKCADCHNEKGWKNSSDFHKNFTLSGVHYSLQCSECHKNSRRLGGMSENCILCHQKDDIHNGTQPNCGSCHRQQFWENAEFKHSLSNFPLRGYHRTLDCYSCHRAGMYKGTPSRCVDCHLSDALSFAGSPNHTLLVSRSCSECHNQYSFK